MPLRCSNRRLLGFAACAPYLIWCLLGHWLHDVSGCCHAHGADAHAHDHAHHACTSSSDAAPGTASFTAPGHEGHCAFCDFARQGQHSTRVTLAVAVEWRGEIARPLAHASWTPVALLVPPARGPPLG